ncbi:hypothetical protein ACIBCM_29665 [Streptomyces sp. NPDC051018]|uniref:hypothetical protein n=1 Tax=Streptomyces sp. NPDC051018 TaxID=3365639 RepID=UPI0037B49B6B
MNDIKELLERAVEDSGETSVTVEAIFAAATAAAATAGNPWRRRVAVGAAVVAVIVVGAVAVSTLEEPGGDDGKDGKSAPAATRGTGPQGTSTEGTGTEDIKGKRQAEKLLRLLKEHIPGLVSVEKVRSGPMRVLRMSGPLEPAPAPYRELGPLDGDFLIGRKLNGTKVYSALSISYRDRDSVARATGGKGVPKDLCAPLRQAKSVDCVRQELSGGRVLSTWLGARAEEPWGTPWSFENIGRLTFPDGGVLMLSDGAYASDNRIFKIVRPQGKVAAKKVDPSSRQMSQESLDFVPLSRAEVRGLLLRGELLPESGGAGAAG